MLLHYTFKEVIIIQKQTSGFLLHFFIHVSVEIQNKMKLRL